MKVVREHYLRDDVWCGVSGCGQCKQGDPLLDTHPDTVSSLCGQLHIILPDTNVVLHQVDFLEDPAITNVILLSVVLQEVRIPAHVCIVYLCIYVYRYTYMYMYSVLLKQIQGMTGGHGLGRACGHIKAFGVSPFPHQRKFCTEGLLGRHTLHMLGRILHVCGDGLCKHFRISTVVFSW